MPPWSKVLFSASSLGAVEEHVSVWSVGRSIFFCGSSRLVIMTTTLRLDLKLLIWED